MDNLPSPDTTVRWGILGCGNIAHDFSLALNALPNAKITAVAARDADRAERFADNHNADKAYSDYQQLVNDPNVDIIYVATIPELHRHHAELALQAGKHVLIEKPLATTVEDAEAIQSLAKQCGKFCMEGMWMRFFPAVELARQLIAQGELGEVRHVRADFGFDLVADEGLDNTKWQAGAGMNAGIYPAHAAVMILGTGLVQLGASGIIDTLGHNMDAEGLVHAGFTDNQTAAISWSHLVGTPEETFIVGSKGTIHLHAPAHAPTKLTVSKLNKTRRAQETFSSTHEFPLPAVSGNFFYPNSEGLYYEAAAVQRCILAGLTECPQLPLKESVLAIQMVQQAVAEITKHCSKD
jgi:dihydrodiol dehydrogenase / D-xylose 1-dehydrogenase (NADP)